MECHERLLLELSQALEHGTSDAQIALWAESPLLQEHELLQASFALLAQQKGLNWPKFPHQMLPGGAIPLFHRGFFPWKGLPYPKEHAELGFCLVKLGDLQTARRMACYQEATLDHSKQPAYSLFMQEGFRLRKALQNANSRFFEALGHTPSNHFQFADHELGMISRRTETSTVICVGSGCKSGLGLFLYQDAGILNWGPQTSPIGKSDGFGLAGRAQEVGLLDAEDHFELSYRCRLSAPLHRKTGFSHLQDSAFSGQWLEAKLSGNLEKMDCRLHFHQLKTSKSTLMLFGQGESCLVAGSHRLKSCSLDRYCGPTQSIQLVGTLGKVGVDCEGIDHMEIIPLASDENYWGADFLIAYILNGTTSHFTFKKI
jgi:hypothetical protein